MKESTISNHARLEASKRGYTLFRNNRGNFRTLDGNRIVQAGLSAKGSSDLIGYKKMLVTPEMVGKVVAIFTAIEVKSSTGKLSPEQQHFLQVVENAGGIAIVYKNVTDVTLL
jgi:hypothetical protein